MARIKRYLLVVVLSFPLALGVRYVLGRLLQEDLPTASAAYVRAHKEKPLSEPLQKILAGRAGTGGQNHPLLGRAAPGFALPDDRGEPVRVDAAADGRPVVLVFYLGYGCVHCVAQLFALDEDVALFDELGARVVAVSPDPPELTAARFKKHGRFRFAVLADPDYRVAEAYGVYRPAAGDEPERLLHGTFLIGPGGRVFWANVGAEPYLDNRTLLIEIDRNAATAGRPQAGLTRPPGLGAGLPRGQG
jgi:peroxiredoxin